MTKLLIHEPLQVRPSRIAQRHRNVVAFEMVVQALAEQIRAKLEQQSSKDGTMTRVIFPRRTG
jgi:hypothetical protein